MLSFLRKRLSILLAVCCVCCLSSCSTPSPEDKLRDQAWEKYKETLKAPSTAKLVSFKAIEIDDEDNRLKYYMQSCHAFQDSLSIIKEWADTKDISDNSIRRVGIEEKDAASEYKKLQHKKMTVDQAAHNLGKIADDLRIKYTDAYKATKDRVKVYIITMTYDAQNSYGAMLRGKGMAVAVCGQESDGDIDFPAMEEVP